MYSFISENYIYKVYYDGDKHIWVGTYDNGFCKLNIENNKVTRYLLTREDGTIRGAFVKNFLKAGNAEGKLEKDLVFGHVHHNFELVNRKVIVPSEEEIVRNPRARSAKLRIARKKD